MHGSRCTPSAPPPRPTTWEWVASPSGNGRSPCSSCFGDRTSLPFRPLRSRTKPRRRHSRECPEGRQKGASGGMCCTPFRPRAKGSSRHARRGTARAHPREKSSDRVAGRRVQDRRGRFHSRVLLRARRGMWCMRSRRRRQRSRWWAAREHLRGIGHTRRRRWLRAWADSVCREGTAHGSRANEGRRTQPRALRSVGSAHRLRATHEASRARPATPSPCDRA